MVPFNPHPARTREEVRRMAGFLLSARDAMGVFADSRNLSATLIPKALQHPRLSRKSLI